LKRKNKSIFFISNHKYKLNWILIFFFFLLNKEKKNKNLRISLIVTWIKKKLFINKIILQTKLQKRKKMRAYNIFIILISLLFAFVLAEEAKKENVEEKTEKVGKNEKDEKKNTEEVKKEREFPEKAYIAELSYGTRCPEADPKHPYEVDEKITRIDFHTNSVVLDINPTIETHNYTISHTCSPYFYVKYTRGYKFAITSYNFRGTYHIDKDVRAVVKSENTDAVTHIFEGPGMGTFDITDELDWTGWKKPHHGTYSEGKLWFGCGTDMIRISVGVEALLNNRLNEEGSGTLVLKDFSANIIWDKCPPEKEKYVPTDEEIIKASIPQPPKKPKEQIEKERKEREKAKAAKKLPNMKDKPTEKKEDEKEDEKENKKE